MNPEEQVATLLAESNSLSTRLGDGVLHWQQWPGPATERPLLLLHGGFGSWTHWMANIRSLRQNRTVWTLDMPGLGASADMTAPHTEEHFAAEILNSLNTLHGARVEFDIAAFSFGALIGAHMAVAAGPRCKHLIVCGAAGFGDLWVQVSLTAPPSPDMTALQAEAITRANLLSLMLSRDEAIDEVALYLHANNLARARFNSRRLARGNGFAAMLPDIQARLCGIWGAADVTTGGRDGIERREALFRRAQPDCTFHILEGIGHWAMYEDAPTINHIIEQELLL